MRRPDESAGSFILFENGAFHPALGTLNTSGQLSNYPDGVSVEIQNVITMKFLRTDVYPRLSYWFSNPIDITGYRTFNISFDMDSSRSGWGGFMQFPNRIVQSATYGVCFSSSFSSGMYLDGGRIRSETKTRDLSTLSFDMSSVYLSFGLECYSAPNTTDTFTIRKAWFE